MGTLAPQRALARASPTTASAGWRRLIAEPAEPAVLGGGPSRGGRGGGAGLAGDRKPGPGGAKDADDDLPHVVL